MNITSEIKALELKLKNAMLSGDTLVLGELLHDDLIFTSQTGMVMTKDMDLSAHKSGALKLTEISQSEFEMRDHSNVVIVSVKAELKGSFSGQSFGGSFRYTRVWSWQDGAWIVVAAHVSEVR